MIALVDCNNFFCSCERVFNPQLRDKPVVVLSNNDGCVVARSNEVKAMGIKMGTPLYQIHDVLEANHVAVFSSNYRLYADMSRRVMLLLSEFTSELTQYSIDEAFMELSGLGEDTQLVAYGRKIVSTVERGTGIPVTIGIAPTKTLAKVASHYGKKYKGYHGVCMIDTEEKRVKALQGFDIGDVWGVGRRTVDRLRYHGVRTAWDLTQKSETWVRNQLTVTGVRMWKELRGESCIHVDELPQKKSICTSRSFCDGGLTRLQQMEEVIANFAAENSAKLRHNGGLCAGLTVFASTSRFLENGRSHTIYAQEPLDVATCDQQELINRALELLRRYWEEDGVYHYKKAGVIVWDLRYDGLVQHNLFDPIDRVRQASLAKAVESIKKKNGEDKIRIAAQGDGYRKFMKSQHQSKQYTTSLSDIIDVKA